MDGLRCKGGWEMSLIGQLLCSDKSTLRVTSHPASQSLLLITASIHKDAEIPGAWVSNLNHIPTLLSLSAADILGQITLRVGACPEPGGMFTSNSGLHPPEASCSHSSRQWCPPEMSPDVGTCPLDHNTFPSSRRFPLPLPKPT